MKLEEKPANFSIKNECRKMLTLPCLKVIVFGVIAQLFILGVFISLFNFSIFHPTNWLLQLFGFHWLKHLPLLGILVGINVSLSKTFFISQKFYPNRFKWLLDNGLLNVILLTLQMLIGVFSSWSFMSYLGPADSSVLIEINGINCLNSRYTFLTFTGLFAGVYYFVRTTAGKDVTLELEDIPKPIFIKLREAFLQSVQISAKYALMPTIGSTLLYWVFGDLMNRRLGYLFNVTLDGQLNSLLNIFTSFKILFFAWLLVTEIFTILNLTRRSFSIFLLPSYEFPIGSVIVGTTQVSLVAALSMQDFPIVQKLAALDFYNVTKMKSKERKFEIFTLSQPGGHPYNWNQLSGQCLSLINAFIFELSSSLKSTPAILQNTPSVGNFNDIQPNSKELAQRILIQQYNEKHNIRRLKSDLHAIDPNFTPPTSTVARINSNFYQTIQQIKQFVLGIFTSIPGLYYLFGEPENAKITFLLSNSDILIWIIQGLASICADSIKDDPYGIVQLTLPQIITTFLKLKIELDKLSNLNLCTKKIDPNLMPLRNALKRSLYKICNAFARYLPELVEDTNDLPFLRTFLYQPNKC